MEPFVHLPEHRLVVCTICRTGCVAKEIFSHLRAQHQDVSSREARDIANAVGQTPNIIQSQEELQRDWKAPRSTIEPVPFIDPPANDGLRCNACRYVARQTRRIQAHCRNKHGWVNERRKGRPGAGETRAADGVPWRVGVRCQRFFKNRAASSWFEVGRGVQYSDEDEDEHRAGDEVDHVAEFWNKLDQEDEESMLQEAKAALREGDDVWEVDPWVDRTGWSKHIGSGLDRDRLRGAMEGIREDEPVLERMWAILESVLDKAYAAASQTSPGSAELFEVERSETQKTVHTPFSGKMEDGSWARYKDRWRVMLSIWQRVQSDSWAEGERPAYRLTAGQKKTWASFTTAVGQVVAGTDTMGRYTEGRLESACLDMVMSILDHGLKKGCHYESIMISALAVMGLEQEGRGWVKAMDYTPVFSAVVKGAKLLVLYQSAQERAEEVARLRSVMSEEDAEEKATGLFRIVRRKVTRFMTRTTEAGDMDPTPMNWILRTRTYGMKIRYTTPGGESIDWRGDQIIHGRVKLGMDGLSDMLHGLTRRTRETLARLTVTGADGDELREMLPKIPWSRIADYHGEMDLGHSFMTDAENEWWIKAGEGWVKRQILASAGEREVWIDEALDERKPYRAKAVREYGRLVEEFREQIFTLMHMTAGQPARSTEILGLRMWNTANGGVRNIFIHEAMVCFVTMYHKGYRKSGDIKVIHRYLPREVGEMLVWYVWLVLPFWQKVQGRLKGKKRRSAFLWADEIMGEEGRKSKSAEVVRTRVTRRRQQAGTGDEDRFQDSGIGSDTGTEMEMETDTEDESMVEEAFLDWFRERKWTSDRARRVLQRHTKEFGGMAIGFSAWRHMAIGIANKYLDKIFGRGGWDEGEEGHEEEGGGDGLVDSILDLQAGHGSHVAGMIYARLFGQGNMGTMRVRDQFRHASMQWHKFLGFGAEDRMGWGLGPARKRKQTEFEEVKDGERRRRFAQLYRTDMGGQLRQMMGPDAEFRGMQEQVIRAVVSGHSPIVQVTPTGGGKSLTFMLPAFCAAGGVTIVVTPLVALENDMEKRCERMGIESYVWKSRGPQRGAPLIFVTPESAVTKGFRQLVERLNSQQKLDRVVVDECHTVLEWTKRFRPQIGALGQTLRSFGSPVICLTATLKPTEESRLFAELGLMKERVMMFRERTRRRNIRYEVRVMRADRAAATPGPEDSEEAEPMSKGRGWAARKEREEEGAANAALVEEVCEVVREWAGQGHKGKAIIYGGTIERVQMIAETLGCVGYWNKAGTAERKARWMEEWMGSDSGPSSWMAATNALGLGVDVPDVRLVVHAGMPRELRNFAQESGRGGRDGGPSRSVVVIQPSWLDGQLKKLQSRGGEGKRVRGDWGWDDDVIEFAGGQGCRRVVLDREMDGVVSRPGCEDDEEACDICERNEMAAAMGDWEEDEARGDWDGVARREAEEEQISQQFESSRRWATQAESKGRQKVMREAVEMAELEEGLAAWSGSCVVCKVKGEGEAYHEMEDCPEEGSEIWTAIRTGLHTVEEEMFGKKRFEAFSACFHCGLPQGLCQRWEEAAEDAGRFQMVEGGACQYAGLLVRAYVGSRVLLEVEGLGVGAELEKWMGDDGVGFEGGEGEVAGQMYRWMGGLIDWGGMQASRMCRMVYLMICQARSIWIQREIRGHRRAK